MAPKKGQKKKAPASKSPAGKKDEGKKEEAKKEEAPLEVIAKADDEIPVVEKEKEKAAVVMKAVSSSSSSSSATKTNTNTAPSSSDAPSLTVPSSSSSSSENWPFISDEQQGVTKPYDEDMIKKLYSNIISEGGKAKIQVMEFNSYFENYLWRHFHKDACFEHIFSIIMILNEKGKTGVLDFSILTSHSENCKIFYNKIIDFFLGGLVPDQLLEAYIHFLIFSFRSLENTILQSVTLRYLSLPIWESLSEVRLGAELERSAQLKRHWHHYTTHKTNVRKASSSSNAGEGEGEASSEQEKEKAGKRKRKTLDVVPTASASGSVPTSAAEEMKRDASWFPSLLTHFLKLYTSFSSDEKKSDYKERKVVRSIERFLELLVDLLSQVPTRKYLKVLLDDMHFVTLCRRASFTSHRKATLAVKLLQLIENYLFFEIDDLSGKATTFQESMEQAHAKIHKLQNIAYTDFRKDLEDLVFSSVGELCKKESLLKYMDLLDDTQLTDLACKVGVVTDKDLAMNGDTDSPSTALDPSLVKDLLCSALVTRERQLDQMNRLSLYPTEELLWDLDQIPKSTAYTGDESLALPKLNMQFLTVHDYLLRNFHLYRLESAYEIREDLADAVKRMGPRGNPMKPDAVTFSGWARMALPILGGVQIDEVAKPKLGESVPAKVNCTVTIDISRYSGVILQEWETLREHDVVFLICIQNPKAEAIARMQEYEKERKLLTQGKKAPKPRDFQWQEEDGDFPSVYGIKSVRGGELFEMRDEDDVVLNNNSQPDERKHGRTGRKRKLRLRLDAAQYYTDIRDGTDNYEVMNLLVRRDPRENNFKAVLETIRDLMNTAAVGRAVPDWLHDVFLGFGSPKSAHYRTLNAKVGSKAEIEHDYVDTFVNAEHLIASFPSVPNVTFEGPEGTVVLKTDGQLRSLSKSELACLPPSSRRFKLTFTPPDAAATVTATATATEKVQDSKDNKKKKRKSGAAEAEAAAPSPSSPMIQGESLLVQSYDVVNVGPYPEDQPLRNIISFTPTQVEAIRSGMNKGLTLIVGPPGTGKTDVAVQIITNLYHNQPEEKILIVTHSNAALNDLFEKIMQHDVAPRHLLRLGSGESELRESLSKAGAGGGGKGQGEAFSKQGRVNWSLSRRLQLLALVQRLSSSLGVVGDHGATCEVAAYFHLDHVQARIEKFEIEVKKQEEFSRAKKGAVEESSLRSVEQLFPFKIYFSDVPSKPLFKGEIKGSGDVETWKRDVETAWGCFRHLGQIFTELEDYRAFELLRTQGLRGDYLLTKQARIVAMTCTHAAMNRRRLVELGFKYDSIVMEEAAQILEVETLIPMLLQDTDPVIGGSRLKRVTLLGDHHQLPPVVKHAALQRFSKFDQSLFLRFVRLGVPTVLLDKQGRARSEIADLYRWRYTTGAITGGLGDLGTISRNALGNAGFMHTTQLVNVGPFQGKGEIQPTPYFYQNLGEAEYLVAVYQYMRLLGYPAEKISILTTYNGQRNLIRDILQQRCNNEVFGFPSAVSTVDKFQGQQSDYILLSLVRTESVGHVRDVRRLVVALSRARLGLYVFCRQNLFENCHELTPALSQLVRRVPDGWLQLVPGEGYEAMQRGVIEVGSESSGGDNAVTSTSSANCVPVKDVTAMGVLVYQMLQQHQMIQQQKKEQAEKQAEKEKEGGQENNEGGGSGMDVDVS